MGTFFGPGSLATPKYDAKAPKGWERTILRMKKHRDITNPWALARWMQKRGMHQKRAKAAACLMACLAQVAATESRPIPLLLQAASAGEPSALAQLHALQVLALLLGTGAGSA